MDEFKKYLQQHKEELDADVPSDNLLKRIQLQTAVNKKGTVYPMLVRIAAAACILALISFGIKWLFEDKKPKVDIASNKPLEMHSTPAVVPTEIKTNTVNENSKHEEQINASSATAKKNATTKIETVPRQLLSSFEYNYTQLVNLQLKNIRSTPVFGETQDYFNDFKNTLRQIDTDEAAIKTSIKTRGLSDELLEQLINVYQQKINVLKNLQHEMMRMNNKVKENQQPSDTLKGHYINI